MTDTKRLSPVDRFWKYVRITPGCWLWLGVPTRPRLGYGRFKAEGKTYLAHVFSYLHHHGDLTLGMKVLHRCDNSLCVNPEHLVAGSQRDNVLDMHSKGRAVIPRGEKASKAKLTDEQAAEAVMLYAQGELTQRQIGAKYGVSDVAISAIVRGKARRHQSPCLSSQRNLRRYK